METKKNQPPPVIIFLNSSKLIDPSPSTSNDSIILPQSLTEQFSPSVLSTACSSLAEIWPFLSLSYMSNASFSSASASASPPRLNFLNSTMSMKPSPSVSSSVIIRATSSSEVLEPSPFRTAPSSAELIFPSPFASNLLNTFSNSSGFSIFSINLITAEIRVFVFFPMGASGGGGLRLLYVL
ncbi:hypothetical protein ABFS82_12G025700 [Erythranthe guttata]